MERSLLVDRLLKNINDIHELGRQHERSGNMMDFFRFCFKAWPGLPGHRFLQNYFGCYQ